MADCKAKGIEVRWSVMSNTVKWQFGISDHCFHCFANFTIHLFPVLHDFCCSVFSLPAFFILCAIRFSLFFNTFQHQACLPSLHVSLLLSVSPFLKSLSCLLFFFSWYRKTTTDWFWSMWMTTKVSRCVVISTYCIMWKCKRIWKTLLAHFTQLIQQFSMYIRLTYYKLLIVCR